VGDPVVLQQHDEHLDADIDGEQHGDDGKRHSDNYRHVGRLTHTTQLPHVNAGAEFQSFGIAHSLSVAREARAHPRSPSTRRTA